MVIRKNYASRNPVLTVIIFFNSRNVNYFMNILLAINVGSSSYTKISMYAS